MKSEDLAVVLLHAGRSSLSAYRRAILIHNQVDTLVSKYGPSVEIIVVLGYDIDGILPRIKRPVRIVENEGFARTSTARSASIGVRATTRNSVYIIYGDLVLDGKMLSLDKNSYILTRAGEAKEVGVAVQDGVAVNLSYGLDGYQKWAGLLFLSREAVDLFKTFSSGKNILIYEVLNKMIDAGVTLGVKSE